ncbi:hypothetical protein PLICRDRAFT_638483 [Plicaturopsis crispa FD-325 SS-3]|nr:hypothetical protein PLICRDRAFT_638483 [Plicaturopsis crispa FD-325 SS-3]
MGQTLHMPGQQGNAQESAGRWITRPRYPEGGCCDAHLRRTMSSRERGCCAVRLNANGCSCITADGTTLNPPTPIHPHRVVGCGSPLCVSTLAPILGARPDSLFAARSTVCSMSASSWNKCRRGACIRYSSSSRCHAKTRPCEHVLPSLSCSSPAPPSVLRLVARTERRRRETNACLSATSGALDVNYGSREDLNGTACTFVHLRRHRSALRQCRI